MRRRPERRPRRAQILGACDARALFDTPLLVAATAPPALAGCGAGARRAPLAREAARAGSRRPRRPRRRAVALDPARPGSRQTSRASMRLNAAMDSAAMRRPPGAKSKTSRDTHPP